MKWNIPERWFEVINTAAIGILFVGLFIGSVSLTALATMGYFIYVLSFFDDLEENDFVESR